VIESRINVHEAVRNEQRRFGAALEYLPVRVAQSGYESRALFTPAEVKRAIVRGKKNREDWPAVETLRGGHLKDERGTILMSDGWADVCDMSDSFPSGKRLGWMHKLVENGERFCITLSDPNDVGRVSEVMAWCEKEFGFIPAITSRAVVDAYLACLGFRGTATELTADVFARIARDMAQ